MTSINVAMRKHNSIDKTALINEVIHYLSLQLNDALVAANNAHLAAIDEQSKPETQYDTLAIEAAYLAEGQSKRIEELKQHIARFKALTVKKFTEQDSVALTALIQLSKDEQGTVNNTWYFVVPAAGGFSTKVKQTLEKVTILFITLHSPIGQALHGKFIDDEITLTIKNRAINTFISAIY